MLISLAEEMNPTRRNTMEDAHVIHAPQTWAAPSANATFIGVYDGHGGRLIADYLEDHLARNVAQEWNFGVGESGGGDDVGVGRKRRRSQSPGGNDDDGGSNSNSSDEDSEDGEIDEGEIVLNSLERAFLLTDLQSKMAGLTTSGATVVCTIIIPKFDNNGKCTDIHIHAANAGDARAVLSSTTARSASSSSNATNKLVNHDDTINSTAVRITQDHKSTDPSEIQRIKAAGGTMIRDRVMGILAVARSLGDHGLKEFVIAKPFLSSTVVKIVDDDMRNDGEKSNGQAVSSTVQSATTHPYTDGEFLIVACDGLWDVMQDDEAVDAVRAHVEENGMGSRTEVAAILVEGAMKRGSTDNITVIVYWL